MRMRKKKHRDDRLAACSDLFIQDIMEYKDNLKAIFGNDNPVHIEIGCGKGKFITELAALNPDVNYIAIERNRDVLVLASEKIKNADINNVKFWAGNCDILNSMECHHTIDRIYVNFCDPWKKSRQAKRRLTHANYLSMYEKLLKKDGELHFKTDNTMLFEFSLNSFSEFGVKMKNITLDLHNSKFEGNVMTEYETLFSQKGQPIYRCEVVFPRR